MAFNIIQEIRRKSREEWEALAGGKLTALRIWVQEHAELASVASLITGILFVLLFKIVMWILIILAAVAFAIWYTAQPSR
jgi:hypothetical protein